jgi:hypothetical protein
VDFGNLEDVAFVDGCADVDIALVGADRDLGRVDVEIGVAAVEVERRQLGQVAAKLFARVLVVARLPRCPVGRA